MAGALASASTLLVNESFSDGERFTQTGDTTLTSLRWTYGAHHSNAADAYTALTVFNGRLEWYHQPNTLTQASFSAIWAHFTDGNTPLMLEDGNSLLLSFSVGFVGFSHPDISTAFRFQLLNSGNSRITTDFAGSNENGIAHGETFNSWRGYEATLPLSIRSTGPSGNLVTRKRTGTGAGLNNSGYWTEFPEGGVAPPLIESASRPVPASLQITRTGNSISLQASINGVITNEVQDHVDPVFSFDTIGFFIHAQAAPSVRLDNIQLSLIPEPSSAALAAFGAFLFCGRRTGRFSRSR